MPKIPSIRLSKCELPWQRRAFGQWGSKRGRWRMPFVAV